MLGLPFVIQALPKMMIPVGVVFGSLFATQYLATSNVYYDEYDGTASEFSTTTAKN